MIIAGIACAVHQQDKPALDQPGRRGQGLVVKRAMDGPWSGRHGKQEFSNAGHH
jgi:hypothetical protein